MGQKQEINEMRAYLIASGVAFSLVAIWVAIVQVIA